MAGEIDFRALSPGMDYGGFIQSLQAGQQAKAQKVESQQRQAQLDRQGREDARAEQQRAAMAGAIDPATGEINPAKASAAFGQAGDLQGAMQFQASQATAKSAKIKAAFDENSQIQQLLGGVTDQGTYTAAVAKAQGMGLKVEGLPPVYDPAQVAALQKSALTVSEQLKAAADADKAGFEREKFGYQQQNDAAGRAVQMRGQDRAASDAAAGRAVTMRGQDVSAMNSAGGTSKTSKRDETNLRKEFAGLQEVKDWRNVTTSYRQIRQAAAKPSAQNDISLIFSYMKMLDPGSVVREGEFATAQNAAGVPDQVRNSFNRAQNGERLNPEQRKGLVSSAAQVVLSRKERFDTIANQYRSYAADYGGNPDRVARPSGTAPAASAPKRVGGGSVSAPVNGVRTWTPR